MTGAATISGPERERIAAVLAEIACAAGEILRRYHRGPCPHALKADGSPSSAADGDAASDLCLAALPVLETRQVGSAVKFGLIAAGEADIYVRCGPTMAWDTAAGDHLVAAAGGCVVVPGGGPIRYGRQGSDHRNG